MSISFELIVTQIISVLLLKDIFTNIRSSNETIPLRQYPPGEEEADSGSRCPKNIYAAGFPDMGRPHLWNSIGGSGLR